MDTPTPPQDDSFSSAADLEAKRLVWEKLQEEMSELHARLQYIKLLLKLGVRNI